MTGATTTVTCEIDFQFPLDSCVHWSSHCNFSGFQSTTESKFINTWPYYLHDHDHDHALCLVQISHVITNAKRCSVSAELDRLPTNRKDSTPTVPAQSTPGTAKTTADAPVQVLTAPHTFTGITTRSFALYMFNMTRRLQLGFG
jgi:hypothetical protein